MSLPRTKEEEEAERDAAALLKRAWSPPVLPVDPVQVAKQLGVDAFATELEPNVSGAIVKRSGRDPIILLNQDDREVRQRFTCARELGHFVRRSNQSQGREDYEYVDLRGTLAATGTDPEEVYVNTFAACLLMPEEMVYRFKKKEGMSVVEMQLAFEVPDDAMENRLIYLGLE